MRNENYAFMIMMKFIKSQDSMSRSSTSGSEAPPAAGTIGADITSKDNGGQASFLLTKVDDHTVSSQNYSCNSDDYDYDEENNSENSSYRCGRRGWSLRRIALELSLYLNLIITFTKLVAYIRTMSLSVLAALLDSVLDVVSQIVLNYVRTRLLTAVVVV